MKLGLILLLIQTCVCIWAWGGIGNDSVVAFKFANFFGRYLPLLSLVLLFPLIKVPGKLLKLLNIGVCIPTIVVSLHTVAGEASGQAQAATTFDEQSFSFVTFSKMTHNSQYKKLYELINCDKYDVIQVQEISDLEAFLKQAPAATRRCHILTDLHDKSLVTFSAYPLKTVEFEQFHAAQVTIKGKQLVLVNLHLIKVIERDASAQHHAVERIINMSHFLPGPVIIAGDFNATPFNQSILRLKQQFAYAPLQGILTETATWPGEGRRLGMLGPLLQIDHVFYKGLYNHFAYRADASYGSDHYPIITEFSFEGQPWKD